MRHDIDLPPPFPKRHPGESLERYEEAIEEWYERLRNWIRHHQRHPVSVNIVVGAITPKGT